MSLFGDMRPSSSPYIKKCPPDITNRIARRTGLELVERNETKPDQDEFVVSGSEGDEYVITIGLQGKKLVQCSCPDKITPCKHICFVYIDILGLEKTNSLVWQSSLTRKEAAKLIPRLTQKPTQIEQQSDTKKITTVAQVIENTIEVDRKVPQSISIKRPRDEVINDVLEEEKKKTVPASKRSKVPEPCVDTREPEESKVI